MVQYKEYTYCLSYFKTRNQQTNFEIGPETKYAAPHTHKKEPMEVALVDTNISRVNIAHV
jgi:hypothetical protein